LQTGVTVSSKKFKKAVERNRVKRVLREAYRLQKIILQDALKEKGISLALFFIYTGKELPVFEELYKKMGIILQRLQKEILNLPAN
jgi:ribonuclease P protein component